MHLVSLKMQKTLEYPFLQEYKQSVQFSSFAQSCPTLCDPMDCSTPGFSVHHQLPNVAQTHVHQVSDAIQSSHPLLSLTGLTGQAHQYLISQIPCRYLPFAVSIGQQNHMTKLVKTVGKIRVHGP